MSPASTATAICSDGTLAMAKLHTSNSQSWDWPSTFYQEKMSLNNSQRITNWSGTRHQSGDGNLIVRMLCVGLSASLRWVGRYDGQSKASKFAWNVYCNEFCTLELKVQVSKPTKLVAVLCRHSHPIVSYTNPLAVRDYGNIVHSPHQ